jgi:hypothetical protein
MKMGAISQKAVYYLYPPSILIAEEPEFLPAGISSPAEKGFLFATTSRPVLKDTQPAVPVPLSKFTCHTDAEDNTK